MAIITMFYEIMADWQLASEGNEIFKIDPLK